MNVAQQIFAALEEIRNEIHALRQDMELNMELMAPAVNKTDTPPSATVSAPVEPYNAPEPEPQQEPATASEPQPETTAVDTESQIAAMQEKKEAEKAEAKRKRSREMTMLWALKRIENDPSVFCEMIKLKNKGVAGAKFANVQKMNNVLRKHEVKLINSVVNNYFRTARENGLTELHGDKLHATDKLRELVKNPVKHTFERVGKNNKPGAGMSIERLETLPVLVNAKNKNIRYGDVITQLVSYKNEQTAYSTVYTAKQKGLIEEQNGQLFLTPKFYTTARKHGVNVDEGLATA